MTGEEGPSKSLCPQFFLLLCCVVKRAAPAGPLFCSSGVGPPQAGSTPVRIHQITLLWWGISFSASLWEPRVLQGGRPREACFFRGPSEVVDSCGVTAYVSTSSSAEMARVAQRRDYGLEVGYESLWNRL